MKDRLGEFRENRVSFQKFRIPGTTIRVNSNSSNQSHDLESGKSKHTLCFLQKVDLVLRSLSSLEQEVIGLKNIHKVYDATAQVSITEMADPGLTVAAFAVSVSANMVPIAVEKRQHHLAMQRIESMCRTARQQFLDLDIRNLVKMWRAGDLTDLEIRIIKEQYTGLQERLHNLLGDYGRTVALFPPSTPTDAFTERWNSILRQEKHASAKPKLTIPIHQGENLEIIMKDGKPALTKFPITPESQLGMQLTLTQEARCDLSYAELQLRDLRKIEEEIQGVKQLFEDLAFLVDSEDHFLDIVDANLEEASVNIVLVTDEFGRAATKQNYILRIKILCTMLNSIVIGLVLLTAGLLSYSGFTVTSGYILVPMLIVLLFSLLALVFSVLYAHRLVPCYRLIVVGQ